MTHDPIIGPAERLALLEHARNEERQAIVAFLRDYTMTFGTGTQMLVGGLASLLGGAKEPIVIGLETIARDIECRAHIKPRSTTKSVEAVQGTRTDAATLALDEIAKLCGCERWDYPGQVVRDVARALLEVSGAAQPAANQQTERAAVVAFLSDIPGLHLVAERIERGEHVKP
jgi:hypothetical protein